MFVLKCPDSFKVNTENKASSSHTSLLSPPSSSMAVKHGPCLLALKKGSRLLIPISWGNLPASCTWSTRPTTGCEARSTDLWLRRNVFWQPSRDLNLRGSSMSHATTSSPKPSFRAPWRLCTLWMAEEMLDGQYQRVDIYDHARTTHKAPCRKDWKRISAETSLKSPSLPNQLRHWRDVNQ